MFTYIREQYPRYCLKADDLDNFYEINELDYKFIDSLTYYMKRLNYTSVQCYTAAGIDKKLFSKIKNNPEYLPSKTTILKFAFALHLNEKEAQQLLRFQASLVEISGIEPLTS